MNERQICLVPDHCDTEDKAIETLHSYKEEYQTNLDRLINKDWQLYLNDISTNDLKKAIVFTLEVCPKHSCKKELLATKVLKFINVRAREKKRI